MLVGGRVARQTGPPPIFTRKHALLPVKADPRDLDLGQIRLTATGIEFLACPTFDEWRHAMQWVNRCSGAAQWWAGDMVNHGENMFGEAAAQEFEKETVRRWAWVCQKVAPNVRRKTLSFTHHEKVAKLPARDQARWLMLAEQEGWSASELAKQIKGEAAPDDDKELCPTCGKPGWDGIYKHVCKEDEE